MRVRAPQVGSHDSVRDKVALCRVGHVTRAPCASRVGLEDMRCAARAHTQVKFCYEKGCGRVQPLVGGTVRFLVTSWASLASGLREVCYVYFEPNSKGTTSELAGMFLSVDLSAYRCGYERRKCVLLHG